MDCKNETDMMNRQSKTEAYKDEMTKTNSDAVGREETKRMKDTHKKSDRQSSRRKKTKIDINRLSDR